MNSSQNRDTLYAVYRDSRSVITPATIAMLTGETNSNSLNVKLSSYVCKNKLLRLRKGIYAKPEYNPEELACTLYTPSYISLEYVLQSAGIIFQYYESITSVSYLSRTIQINDKNYSYRRIKDEIIINTDGIIRHDNINIATPERAFLDMLYLEGKDCFDNIHPLDKMLVCRLLHVYNSKTLSAMVNKLFKNEYK